jgi:hypothetical protein
MKRGALSTASVVFSAGSNTSNNFALNWRGTDALDFYDQTASVNNAAMTTTAVYRDPSAWYHIVFVFDTTQATSTNRWKSYVNGVQITSFSATTYPTQNYQGYVNSTVAHYLGVRTDLAQPFDGYLAETNFIDGLALTPSFFGTYDTNGVWQPVKYSGSFGTNGFYLNFGNTTSTTTLGYDTSGNGNNWTTNNFSLTAGSTYDSMTDSPTVSTSTVANYCTLNPLAIVATGNPFTVSNGNLTYSQPTDTAGAGVAGTFFVNSGKWYWEGTVQSTSGGAGNSTFTAGLLASNFANGSGTPFPYRYIGLGTTQSQAGVSGPTLSSYGAGDTVMVALDVTGSKLYFGKNGVWGNSAVPASGTGACFTDLASYTYFTPAVGNPGNNSTSFICNMNFGQQPFLYTPPTGFSALNTYNLPTPTITNGAQYMAATLYTGNGSTLTINNGTNTTIGTTFQPDFAWLKSRSAATSNSLSDVLRGIGANSSYPRLISDSTAAESTNGGITSFASTGLSLNADAAITNTNAATYVAWQWKAGGSSGVSNTNGSITSTVSANTTAGFSIVTYTGTGTSNPTIGHGLGVAPNMIILKDRNTNSQNNNWQVYHSSLTSNYFLSLNTTDAQAAISGTSYGSVGQPTSTTFTGVAGSVNSTTTNQSGQAYVAYCWAAVAGYSAFGSYTGNGSSDGPFVYCGFRPRWIMLKSSSGTGVWNMIDSSRSSYNMLEANLEAQSSGAETGAGTQELDLVSNGFKYRGSSTNASYDHNASGVTYIYAAFAETPFNSSRAR